MDRLLHRLLLTVVIACATLTGQAIDRKDYKEYADTIRREVWAQQLPEFQHPARTDRFANHSAVILAAYEEFDITKSNRLNFNALGNMSAELHCHLLTRTQVQINDEAALRRYSEFDYLAYSNRRMPYYGKVEQMRVLGVRVIKPDGTVNEVSTDDYVTTAEGRKGREERQMLAVPGLQVGDIIDIFTFFYTRTRDIDPRPLRFCYISDCPMLSYRVHCEIDRSLSAQYRTLNGAPDFKVSSNANNDYVLDARVTGVEQTEPNLWYKTARQTPQTLLYVQIKPTTAFGRSANAVPRLTPNPNCDRVQAGSWESWQSWQQLFILDRQDRAAVKRAKALYADEEQRADYLYDRCAAYALSTRLLTIDNDYFIGWLRECFKKAGISFQCGLTTSDSCEPLDQLAFYDNVTWFLRLPSGKYYFAPTFACRPGDVPSELQGQQAVVCTHPKQRLKEGPYERLVLPQSEPADNQAVTTIEAAIEGTRLNIQRQVRMTGVLREGPSVVLPSRAQLVESRMRRHDAAFTRSDLYSAKQADAIAEQGRADMEALGDHLLMEVTANYDTQPAGAVQGRVLTVGDTDAEPALTYETTFTMDGLVKRAGQNLVVAVGKLQGDALRIEGKDRERTADIWRTAPTVYAWNISVTLPEGYSVSAESLAALGVNCQNAAGSFKVDATSGDGRLQLKAECILLHRHEPAANWPLLLELYDRMADFNAQQVVLRQ